MSEQDDIDGARIEWAWKEMGRLRAEVERLTMISDNAVERHRKLALENERLLQAATEVLQCWGHDSPLWNNLRNVLVPPPDPPKETEK